jgi:hypothetical protein
MSSESYPFVLKIVATARIGLPDSQLSPIVQNPVPHTSCDMLNDTGTGSNDTGINTKLPTTSAKDMKTTPRNGQSALNEQEEGADNAKDRGERRPRKCGCACESKCNCKCTCSHRAHCVCKTPCNGQCGTQVSRNLVVSIDGTSNQFGWYVSG